MASRSTSGANESPENKLRRELRAEQKHLFGKWQRKKDEIVRVRNSISNFKDIVLNDESNYSPEKMERIFPLDGFDAWPTYCIWFGNGRGSTVGSCGYVEPVPRKKHWMEYFAKGPIFWILVVLWIYSFAWIIYIALEIDFNNQPSVLKWIEIAIGWAVPIGFRWVLIPRLARSKEPFRVPTICPNNRRPLDVYCLEHRTLLNSFDDETVENLFTAPVEVPGYAKMKTFTQGTYQSSNDKNRNALNSSLNQLEQEFIWIEKKLEIARDKLSSVESGLRRKKLPENMRLTIYAKYDFQCAICSVDLKLVKPHIDHIIPISKGGADSLENLQPLCETCNLRKGSKYYP